MSHVLDRTAQTDVPILDVLAERWSTRVFDAEAPIDEERSEEHTSELQSH